MIDTGSHKSRYGYYQPTARSRDICITTVPEWVPFNSVPSFVSKKAKSYEITLHNVIGLIESYTDVFLTFKVDLTTNKRLIASDNSAPRVSR